MSNIIEPDTKFRPSISSILEPQIDWAHGSIVLGRSRQAVTELGLKGTMCLGVICEHQTTGASLFGYKVLFDNKFPHIIFICGKRGSGKSYTLGVIVEELGRSRSGIGSIVIDPLGTFWAMKNKSDSKKAEETLARYGLTLKDFNNVQVLTPIGFYEDMKSSVDGAFSIGVSDLSVDDWCMVFDIDRFKTQGLLLGDVLDKIINGYDAKVGKTTRKIPPKKKDHTIGDIIFCIKNDVTINSSSEGYAVTTRRSVIARLKSAAKWGVFSVNGTPINEISIRNKITVLDVSHSKLGSSRRALIVGILARKILEARIESSRKEEASKMGIKVSGKELIPVTWLIIDEAHLLLPASGKTAATESLIEYAKLGRKPGCGLVFATQRPSATNEDILSQVDTIIGHNLALEDDIAALRRRIPAKMPGEFKTSDFIRSMPVGIALFADQKTQQRTMLVQIRPRMTHHSGKAAVPKSDEEQRIADETEMNLKLEIESESELKLDQMGEPVNTIKPEILITEEDVLKPSIDVSGWELSDDEDNDETLEANVEKQQKTMKLDKQAVIEKGTESIDEPQHKGLETGKGITNQIIDHDLVGGEAYILLSEESKFGLNIYENNYKQNPKNTLCITRTHPNKLDLQISKDNINQIWLSKSPEKNSISPGNITKIAHIINEYLKTNNDGVILLDGLEYLITNNDFPKILKFIESVHERIVLSNGIILIPINPSTLSKNNLDLLKNELGNSITDTISDYTAEFPAQKVEKTDGIVESKKSQEPKVRRANKEELKALCKKLGLGSTGKIEDLKKRLLEFEEGKITPSQMDDGKGIDSGKVKAEIASEEPVKSQIITDITADEEQILKGLGSEREVLKSLFAEREKLKEDIEKLREEEQKHKLELKRKKLLIEREKLKEEKEQLEADRKKLEQQLQLKAEKLKRGSGLDVRTLIDEERAKQKIKTKQLIPKQLVPLRSKKGKRLSAGRDLGRDGAPITRATAPTRKGKGKGKGNDRADIISEAQEKRMLVIKSRLRGGAIEEFAIKQLKTSLLGKPVEVIKNIRPVYLPILRIYVKAMRGTIFAKEHSGVFYWDMVTGEVITDFGKVLKRSKGLSMLIDLSPNQAKVLAAMDTWGSNDIVDLQNEINIPANEIKRALTALKKKSLVAIEHHSEKRIDNYKRMIELKFPKKFDKIKVEMPRIVKGNVIDEIMEPNYKLTELEKLVSNLLPGTRIVNSEEVYYPYFQLDIVGKAGPRNVLLDAVTGGSDKTLTEYFQYSG